MIMKIDCKKCIVETFNHARDIIRRTERLAQEACMEELCKIILVKLCYERKNQKVLSFSALEYTIMEESVDCIYQRLFQTYVPPFLFDGWDRIELKRKTFGEVITMLEDINLSEADHIEMGKAFTSFLQVQYGGYINDYSTPDILTRYIFDVLDMENVINLFDPCSGIGGMLAEAYRHKGEHLMLSGNDISRTMVNISRLHLKMYGYQGDNFTCADFTDKRSNNNICYDCIVAHIPTRRQIISAAHRIKDEDNYYNFEEFFIKNIINHLKIGGYAAIVVPKDMMEKRDKRYLRHHIMENTELVNITQFNDVFYRGHSTPKDYQILFVRKTGNPSYGDGTATLLNSNDSEDDIRNAAMWVKAHIKGESSLTEISTCKYYRYYDVENWNISLLFIRDKIGKKYEPVLLKDILTKRRDRAQIIQDKEYDVLRVRRRGLGVEIKRSVLGSSISDTMFEAKTNDLVISSFEADMGGLGLVNKDLDGGIVTKDLYLFEVDRQRVDLNYLLMVLTSEPVQEQLQAMNKREYMLSRISLSNLMSVMIPLPDLDTQKTMAKELQKNIDKAQKAEDELSEGRKNFRKNLFG